MTSPRQHSSSAGLGWVDLEDGVTFSRAWLTTNTPGLFAAWEHAQTQEHRHRLAAQIQQAARLAESTDDRAPCPDYVGVIVQWAETTRYEAEFYLDPTTDADALWSEIADLPNGQRRTLGITNTDNRIISVVALDRDTALNFAEKSPASTSMIDFGDVADSIDERIAESAGWPALNRDLNTAARHGYDAAAMLAALAAKTPLPKYDAAAELRYRLIETAAMPSTVDNGHFIYQTGQPPRRNEGPAVDNPSGSSITAHGF